MSQGLLFISCITPLHNGGIESIGMVDRPIVRERITGYPFIQSTTLKGAFREAMELASGGPQAPEVVIVFGDADAQGSKNIGFLDLVDASLVAFPVRSLLGGHALLTCESLLARLDRFAQDYGVPFPGLQDLVLEAQNVSSGELLLSDTGANRMSYTSNGVPLVFLEEFAFTRRAPAANSQLEPVAKKIKDSGLTHPRDRVIADSLAWRFAVVSDDDFAYFVEHATEIHANIEIGNNGVTVKGSLRYTEYLPQETLLVAPFQCRNPFSGNGTALTTAVQVANKFAQLVHHKRMQIGADETTGKGIVRFAIAGFPQAPVPPSPAQPQGTDQASGGGLTDAH